MLIRAGTFFLFVASMFVVPAMIASTANAFEDPKPVQAQIEHNFDRGMLEANLH